MLGIGCSERSADEAPPRPPNLVVILADDLRADALEAPFQSFAPTPALDRLAAEGVRFEQAFAVTALCNPSRASILTGLYTHRTGVSANRMSAIREPAPELALRLRAAGYETAFVGKYHLGNRSDPRDGFDRWAALTGRYGQGKYVGARVRLAEGERELEGHSVDALSGLAAEWIAEMRGHPFFLLLSLKDPHPPTIPAERHATQLQDASIPVPASARDPLSELPESLRIRPLNGALAGLVMRMSQRGDPLVEVRREYARSLLGIDDAVARIDAALAAAGLRDDTLVAFTSDHGVLLGEHGLWRKELAYEEAIRIPLVLRHPREIAAGTVSRELALNVDLTATLLARAGAPSSDLDGRDLYAIAARERPPSVAAWRSQFVYLGPYLPARRPDVIALRGRDWKYVRLVGGELEEQLFDLARDAGERRNLASDRAHAGRLADARAELARALQQLGVPAGWLEPGAGRRSVQRVYSR